MLENVSVRAEDVLFNIVEEFLLDLPKTVNEAEEKIKEFKEKLDKLIFEYEKRDGI